MYCVHCKPNEWSLTETGILVVPLMIDLICHDFSDYRITGNLTIHVLARMIIGNIAMLMTLNKRLRRSSEENVGRMINCE